MADKLQVEPQLQRAARLLSAALPQVHLSREEFDDALAGDALDIYLRALDFEHVYFLQSDIDEFRASSASLDDQLRKGDIQLAIDIYKRLKERVADRLAFTENLLTNEFDLTVDESYVWKRKDAPWPASKEDWDEIWRKKIKNEYVGRLVSRTLADEEPADTNTVAKVDAEAEETADIETPAEKEMTPQESIIKSYKRYLSLLEDNEASWVTERYLTSFTQAYDPHSDYMSAYDAEDFDITMKLSLVGIGALLSTDEGAARVERLIPGGPAERDGRLKPGDRIIAVAQGDEEPVDTMHWPLNKTVRLIRGEKNTKVILTVLPASDPYGSVTKKIDLIREEVKLEEQAAKGTIHDVLGTDGTTRSLGVIKLPEFYADMRNSSGNTEPRSASRDVRKILEDFAAKGVEGIILDLRNNGGGSLTEARDLTGEFIDMGPVVQVKDTRRIHIMSDPEPGTLFEGSMVVLVNRMSASASEILAAALQDYGRAVIVGDSKTHGKGTVQTLTYLNDQDPQLGSLKVTTASFYRISGGSTQRNGVTPDIVIPSLFDSMELGEETLPHAMPWSEVYQAFYEPRADLGPLVSKLREQSDSRRSTDPRFEAYSKLLARVRERQDAKEITLNLEQRLQLARDERELQKLLRAQDEAKDKDDKADLVLGESLNILSDLIQQQRKVQADTTPESHVATKG